MDLSCKVSFKTALFQKMFEKNVDFIFKSPRRSVPAIPFDNFWYDFFDVTVRQASCIFIL